MLQQTIASLSQHPKRLFLIDGLGALLSAVMLGVILVQLESMVGIPYSTLCFLSALPAGFAAYDMVCYLMNTNKQGILLKVIASLNIIYACISISYAFYHFSTITALGWIYIILEIFIIVILAGIELKVANKISKK